MHLETSRTGKSGFILWIAAAAIGTAIAAMACSSSSGNDSSCVSSTVGSSCYSCAQSKCGSQISSFESSCTAYLNCACSNGVFNASTATMCQSDLTTSCQTASSAIDSCTTSSCPSQCGEASDAGGGG